MRTIWVKIEPYDHDMVTAAIEGGADALLLPPGCAERAKQLGRIPVIAEDGDLQPGKSELSAGDAILVVNADGKTTPAIVGRVKIEKRPLLLLKACHQGRELSVILQNAETIRLIKPGGEPVSVVALQQGESVLVACEEGGRHFGHAIQESIREQ